MVKKEHRVVSFDLDTNKMKNHFKYYQEGYRVLGNFFNKNGYERQEGSMYISKDEISEKSAIETIRKAVKANPWLADCKKDCRLTVAPKNSAYDLNKIIDNAYKKIEKQKTTAKHQLSPELLALARNAPKTNKEPLVLPRQKSKPDCNENF